PATRVMSLRDGLKKMSKSDESDNSRINLTDDADAIAQKIRKAKTDPHPLPSNENEFRGRPEAENLINIYAALSDEPVKSVRERSCPENIPRPKGPPSRTRGWRSFPQSPPRCGA